MATIRKKVTETITVAGALLGPGTILAGVFAHDQLKLAPFKPPFCMSGGSWPAESESKKKPKDKDDPCLYGRVGGFGA